VADGLDSEGFAHHRRIVKAVDAVEERGSLPSFSRRPKDHCMESGKVVSTCWQAAVVTRGCGSTEAEATIGRVVIVIPHANRKSPHLLLWYSICAC